MIQVFKPFMGEEEVKAVEEVIKSGWLGLGPKTVEFEKKFAKYIGTKFSVGLNSATSALDLALKLLHINHGDEVIVPTMTFVSTAHVVTYNLATPIFVDIDPKSLLINFEDLKAKITSRTKAVIPVHYSGRAVDIDKLREIVGEIPIVEDAAHACGSIYKDKKCGSLGDIGCFSFHAVKNLATGDGGALTLNNQKWYERSKKLRWLGIDKGTWDRTELDKSYWWQYFVDEIGLKCHMNDISASIGLIQLKKLDSMNTKRKKIAEEYTNAFRNVEWIETPLDDDNIYQSSWHIYCIKCENRDELSSYLKSKGIATGVHYKPIHQYKCYGNTPSLPIAERVAEKILSLPIYPGLSDREVDYIIESILSFKD
ncbi:MAG: DegT/DnrJ/EryC1/StrS family aminotransferase [Actinomycetia bacterium]|nr:DegT/DnrJ/EryC1/StrS family aminotransferase [Actinomycetes bacterium]